MKKILTWHLRKDLNLRSRWWHRLVLILYVLAIIISLVFSIGNSDLKFFDYPQWRLVDTVEERLDSGLHTLYQLRKPGEKIDDTETYSYLLNNGIQESYLNDDFYRDVYCSKIITNYISDILRTRNINNLELSGSGWVSLEEFSSFIIKHGDKCVMVDSYSNYGGFGGKVYFLRPESVTFVGTFSKEWGFHEVSFIKSILFFAANLMVLITGISIIFYIASIVYHKVILYIVFGKK